MLFYMPHTIRPGFALGYERIEKCIAYDKANCCMPRQSPGVS